MRLIELIHKVDRSADNTCSADIEKFSNTLDIPTPWDAWAEFEMQVKKYWIHKWMCTDSVVGLAVYYFLDKPVAISYQRGRKCSEDIAFLTKSDAESIRNFILELSKKSSQKEIPIVTVKEMLEDLGEGGKVAYSSELLGDKVIYNGQLCNVEHKYGVNFAGKLYTWDTVDILYNGEVINVRMQDVKVPYNII